MRMNSDINRIFCRRRFPAAQRHRPQKLALENDAERSFIGLATSRPANLAASKMHYASVTFGLSEWGSMSIVFYGAKIFGLVHLLRELHTNRLSCFETKFRLFMNHNTATLIFLTSIRFCA
jgi:hypothetical protein